MKRFYTFCRPHPICNGFMGHSNKPVFTCKQHLESIASVETYFLFDTYEAARRAADTLFHAPRPPKTSGRVAPMLIVELDENALPDKKVITANDISRHFLPPNYAQGSIEQKFECYVSNLKDANLIRVEYSKTATSCNQGLKAVELSVKPHNNCIIL